MPKGNVTPRERSIKTLFRDYTTGISSSAPESDQVKALRRKIMKREDSLLKNSNQMTSRQVP